MADHPRSAALHFERGKLELEAGNLAEARKQFETAIRYQPKASEYHFELSRVFHQLQMPEERAELEAALRLDSQSASAHNALANLLKSKGDMAGARAEFSRLQEIKQNDVARDIALGHMRAGVKLAQGSDYSAAAGEFRQAVEANPRLAEGWFDLAGALLQTGKIDEAIQTFPKAIALAPRWPEAHFQFALALLKSGQQERALSELHVVIEQDPEHAGAKRELAKLTAAQHAC